MMVKKIPILKFQFTQLIESMCPERVELSGFRVIL